MSIFKKIKSAFIIEEEGTTETSPTTQEKNDPSIPSPKDDNEGNEASYNAIDGGKINQKFTDILLRALESNNEDGFDYIEFKKSIQNLFAMNMEEATVFKSAFATAKTLGATPQGLISSAEKYLQVLAREEKKFEDALKNQRSRQIDGGKTELEKGAESIARKQEQIRVLEEEIAAQQKRLERVRKEISQATAKIEGTRSDFVASYDNLVSQIKKDIENINTYLN